MQSMFPVFLTVLPQGANPGFIDPQAQGLTDDVSGFDLLIGPVLTGVPGAEQPIFRAGEAKVAAPLIFSQEAESEAGDNGFERADREGLAMPLSPPLLAVAPMPIPLVRNPEVSERKDFFVSRPAVVTYDLGAGLHEGAPEVPEVADKIGLEASLSGAESLQILHEDGAGKQPIEQGSLSSDIDVPSPKNLIQNSDLPRGSSTIVSAGDRVAQPMKEGQSSFAAVRVERPEINAIALKSAADEGGVAVTSIAEMRLLYMGEAASVAPKLSPPAEQAVAAEAEPRASIVGHEAVGAANIGQAVDLADIQVESFRVDRQASAGFIAKEQALIMPLSAQGPGVVETVKAVVHPDVPSPVQPEKPVQAPQVPALNLDPVRQQPLVQVNVMGGLVPELGPDLGVKAPVPDGAEPEAILNFSRVMAVKPPNTGLGEGAPVTPDASDRGGGIGGEEPLMTSSTPHKAELSAPNSLSAPKDIIARALPAQISQAVLNSGEAVTDLRLMPEELGAVRIEMRSDGERMVMFVSAERQDTLDLLRRNSEKLVAEMRDAGFDKIDLDFGRWSGSEHDRRSQNPNEMAIRSLLPDEPAPQMINRITLSADKSASGGLYIRI